jgi:hypothetical protein
MAMSQLVLPIIALAEEATLVIERKFTALAFVSRFV